tara:strand:- start:85 stop:618 length:534 start_codon:yes stop_codon:yes gene_type:complete
MQRFQNAQIQFLSQSRTQSNSDDGPVSNMCEKEIGDTRPDRIESNEGMFLRGRLPRQNDDDALSTDSEVFMGDFGSNNIIGGSGDDSLFGLYGDDILSFSRGSDILDGGNVVDVVDYSDLGRPIVLGKAGIIQKGRNETDIVRDIEVIVGAEGRPNLINVISDDTESEVSIEVNLLT